MCSRLVWFALMNAYGVHDALGAGIFIKNLIRDGIEGLLEDNIGP